MKLALFHNPNSNKPYVGDELTDKYCPDLVRTSEWVEVTFPPLSLEARQEQLARVEAAREAVRKLYEDQLTRINQNAEALTS
jgi:hypothetical protein